MEPVPVPHCSPQQQLLRSHFAHAPGPSRTQLSLPTPQCPPVGPTPRGRTPLSPATPVPSVPVSLRDVGGLIQNLLQLGPPAQNGGVKAAGEWGWEVLVSSHALTSQAQPGRKAEASPSPPRVTRGHSRAVAGWGGTPKLTRSGAAGRAGPRVLEGRNTGGHGEPRLCSRGEARGGSCSRGRLGGRVGEELASRPRRGRVLVPTRCLAPPATFVGADAHSSEPRFLLRVRNRAVGGPGQGCVARLPKPMRFGA